VKVLEELSQCLRVTRITENKTVNAVLDKFAHPGEDRSNHGQATSHGFGDRQAERVFKTRADVKIGCSIEVQNLLAGGGKVTSFQNTEPTGHFAEGIGGFTGYGDKLYRQTAKNTHSLKNRGEAFDAQVVAEEKEHEIILLKFPALPSGRAAQETCDEREYCRVHTVGNDPDVLPVKIAVEELRGALGNSCKVNLRIGVNAAFQPG
jgi:hypothetical protein